jgi:hypothetical protein
MSMSDEGFSSKFELARAKTNVPGILLIIVGLLNAVAAAWMLFAAQQAQNARVEDIEREMEKNPAQRQQLEQLKKQGYTMQQMVDIAVKGLTGFGSAGIVAALLTIIGGWQMRSLRAYPLAFIGSLLAAIPCISPGACCLLGEVAGLWGLVVLLNSDVSSMFGRAPPMDVDNGGDLA